MVHIVVLPMGLQAPLAPSVLSLDPPLRTLCSVQWLAESIPLCICQALIESLRRQLDYIILSTSTCWSGFGDCIWDGFPGGAVSGWPFLQSLLHTLYLTPPHTHHHHGYFVPPSKKDLSIHILVFLLLELHRSLVIFSRKLSNSPHSHICNSVII